MMVGPRAAALLTLLKEETIIRNRALKLSSFSGSSWFDPRDLRCSNTIEMSKVSLYLGRGGLCLNTAFTALQTSLCAPAGVPSYPR